jgi:hypothetical protein
MEIVNSDGNVVNGIIGLKRDVNLQSLEFFHSYEDIREVLFGFLINIFYTIVYV